MEGELIESSLDIKIPYTVIQYSTKQGLPQSQVIKIIPKKNGELIIATANGIIEYNGSQFKHLPISNEYKKYIYTNIFWHEKTQQLFGEEIKGTLHLIYPNHKIIQTKIVSAIVNDTIFSINFNGKLLKSNVNKYSFKEIGNSNIKNARALIYFSNSLYIGNGEGLFQYNFKSNKVEKVLEGGVTSLKINPFNKSLYALGTNLVYKIKDKNITSVMNFGSNETVRCNDIDFIDSTEFFLATYKGLYAVTADYIDCYTKKNALPSQFIQSLYYNQIENCLFAGTGEKGLLKLQLKNCYSFSSGQGFQESASLSSVIKTSQNDVIVGETFGTLYKVGIDTISIYSPLRVSYSCLAEINGTVFAGTWGAGVKLLKDAKPIGELTFPVNLPNKSVHGVYQDSKGLIWIGTSDGIASGSSVSNIKPLLNDKVKNRIICFFELRNGNICLGGANGIYILDKNKNISVHLTSKDGLECKEVRSFYEDSEGKLWIGTYGGGLYCYHKNKLTSINKLKNAMLDPDVFTLAKDNYGHLLISSNHGLWRLNEKKLSDFYFGKINYLIPFYYGEENGILNTEFNGGFQNNYLRTKLDHFYFPSLQGIVIVAPEEPVYRKLTPTINRVLVNDSLVELSTRKFNRKTYLIQFDFSCINYLNKYNVYYQFKLESENINNQNNWSSLKKSQTVNFKLLPPGSYTFKLRAIDGFNDDRPEVVSFDFEIVPFFYETTSFKVTSTLIILTLTIAIVRYRIQRYRKKAEEKEFYKRTLAELELKAIQSQLNPHFIFNCLNTIKFFILNNDFEKANTGLNHFSKMLRDIINNSEQPTISLKKEIEFITDYLELEKMRLEDGLLFNISVEPMDLDTHIPAMLIQPHVENAIKHGIANLTSKIGELNIVFMNRDSFLEVHIQDNGIGRTAALKISKTPEHISVGISLTSEKSKVLNIITGQEIRTEITDLYSENNNPLGTRVIIKIPFYDYSHH